MQRNTIISALLILLYLTVIVYAIHAQEAAPAPTPAPTNQHWKIVPHVSPDGLQAELEKLNREGYSVDANNWEIIDNQFVIHVSDADKAENKEEQDDN